MKVNKEVFLLALFESAEGFDEDCVNTIDSGDVILQPHQVSVEGVFAVGVEGRVFPILGLRYDLPPLLGVLGVELVHHRIDWDVVLFQTPFHFFDLVQTFTSVSFDGPIEHPAEIESESRPPAEIKEREEITQHELNTRSFRLVELFLEDVLSVVVELSDIKGFEGHRFLQILLMSLNPEQDRFLATLFDCTPLPFLRRGEWHLFFFFFGRVADWSVQKGLVLIHRGGEGLRLRHGEL
ncbi:MAG: hypothetical protein DRP93_05000 [Candidatus Neomarinimicrobiota bacterium]|nr:MAG: hypothetical protein DRP93_05000 [Candidatus Neomarinimicrobiota bacterium]